MDLLDFSDCKLYFEDALPAEAERLIAQAAAFGPAAWALVAATLLVNLRSRWHPLWLIGAGAVLGLLGLV